MKTFKQFLIESEKAVEFVSGFITSSALRSKIKLSSKDIKFLKKTVIKDLVLYRGLSILKSRLDKTQFEEVQNLSKGDKVPDFLKVDKFGNSLVSWTKKKTLAKHYAKDGKVSIIIKAKVPVKNIIADLENLEKVINFEQEELDEDDFKYFKQDKEVIVQEPVDSIVEEIF
jgi:hypothetical protein